MKFFETYEYEALGYKKLFHHHNWRVAILNYIDELDVDKISYVECHQLTDEVFVLLKGEAHLFFVEEKDRRITRMVSLALEQGKVYKVPAGVFHTHTLSKDAKLLIVEEEDTSYDNSPRIYLSPEEKIHLKTLLDEGNHGI
jgi:cupin superfamily acireductone dioxygenase involved in methionine salvage